MWRWVIYGLACITSLVMALSLMIQAGGILYPEKLTFTLPEETQGQSLELEFPYTLQEDSLVLEQVVSYEGPFQEDGSGEPAFDVLAIVLRNGGTDILRSADITLEHPEQTYYFHAEDILPGMAVMVPERDRGVYRREGFHSCSAEVAAIPIGENLLPLLELEPEGMGKIRVTNLSDHTLGPLRLYHKNYLPEGIFVGGRSFVTQIDVLASQQSVLVPLSHYAEGYSKIFYAEEAGE